MKKTESVLNECQAELQEKGRRIFALESSLADKDKELAITMSLNADKVILEGKLKKQEEEHRRDRTQWVSDNNVPILF